MLSLVVILITLILGGGIIFALVGGFSIANMGIPLILALIGILIIGFFMAAVAHSIAYNVVDGIFKRKETPLLDTFSENMMPMLKYVIVSTIICIVTFGPFILAYLAFTGAISLGTSQTTGLIATSLAEIIFRLVIAVVAAVVYLFTQFAIFELLIGKRGIIESFGNSFSIVKKNPIETIVFSFVLWTVETAVQVPFIIVGVGGAVLLLFVMGFIGTISPIMMIPLVLIALIAILILYLLYVTVTTALVFSAQYIYWNKIREV